ncbi:hypothetical protein, partial [Streptomyces mirabilis]|uniref:hypothetical protein n=1 Tax=Streptomyces mirabilis TaxID=68239 RepID=UPI0033A13A91
TRQDQNLPPRPTRTRRLNRTATAGLRISQRSHSRRGGFNQTFATELGGLFGDDPPGDAELAAELDKELRKALPG